MTGPFPMTDADRRANFLASAADADAKAAASNDEVIRTGWGRVADGYRNLAAGVALTSKL
jgi:hypothetical protein